MFYASDQPVDLALAQSDLFQDFARVLANFRSHARLLLALARELERTIHGPKTLTVGEGWQQIVCGYLRIVLMIGCPTDEAKD